MNTAYIIVASVVAVFVIAVLVIVIDSFFKPRDVRKGLRHDGYYIEVRRLFWNCLEELSEVREYTDIEIDGYPLLNEETADMIVAEITENIKNGGKKK